MASQHYLDLIKTHAPILWLHRDEAFLPENCRVMQEKALLGTARDNLRRFTVEELGDLVASEKYFMDIPELHYEDFGVGSRHSGPELGPESLSAHASRLLGRTRVPAPVPVYHARVSEIRISATRDEPFSRFFGDRDPGILGNYRVIQYFFFFIFNDAWNKHIGDWDAALELYIKEGEGRGYAVYHMHQSAWVTRYGGNPVSLTDWLAPWEEMARNEKEGKKMEYRGPADLVPAYQFAQHPFVFIARGAHGGYPTPGFSVHGVKAIKPRVIGQTDYREIGKLCIYSETPAVNPGSLNQLLERSGISTTGTVYLSWGEPVLLADQPWLKYKGLWGTRSDYLGWAGPTGPAQKEYWQMNATLFKEGLCQAAYSGFTGEKLFRIFRNWHGWKA